MTQFALKKTIDLCIADYHSLLKRQLGIILLSKIINTRSFIYFLSGLIMIQLFKFLPNNMKKFMFLGKTDISTFADQSFHFYSKFLQMSSYSHPSKKINYFLCESSEWST